MLTRPCPHCGHTSATMEHCLYNTRVLVGSEEECDLGVSVCNRCGGMYANPCPINLPFAMQHSYGHSTGREVEQVQWMCAHIPETQRGCLVDIGCGEGKFVQQIAPLFRSHR